MKVLVTGGAGFIGSHLVEILLKEGHEVVCIDNLSSSDGSNLRLFKLNPMFSFINHDVCTPICITGIDRIYHLACPASPVHYQADPIQTMKVNVIGTLNMLELAEKTNARFLLTSTSEVYGDPVVHPQAESYLGNVNCTGRRSCYDEGKRSAESLTFDFFRCRGVDVRVARIFNTYGPRMLFHDGRVVSNFLVQALKGEPLSVYGDGSQTRSFCYVTDLIDGLKSLMERDASVDGFRGPCNLGNPAEFSVKSLADMVISSVQPIWAAPSTTTPTASSESSSSRCSQIAYRCLPSDDPVRRRPVTDLAQQYLNWAPSTPLPVGLLLTAKEFRERALIDPSTLYCLHQQEASPLPCTNEGHKLLACAPDGR